jgi:uncharacterized protein (DUF697 family)
MPKVRKTIQNNPLHMSYDKDVLDGANNILSHKGYFKPSIQSQPIFKEKLIMSSAEAIIDEEIGSSQSETGNTKNSDYRNLLAKQTVTTWAQWGATAGFIPTVGLATPAILAIQVKMVHSLCKVYNVPFKKEVVLAAVSSLVGANVAVSTAQYLGENIVKSIPYVGHALVFVTQPATTYATTYALGAVFIDHFETKGNLLDINLDKLKDGYKSQISRIKNTFKGKRVEDSGESTTPV